MFRRVVTLLMLPCVLLPHAAAYGHTHSGGQPTGHDLRPHVHTAPQFHDHGHHHHHGGHHHGHHHHDDDHVTPQPGTDVDADRESVPVPASDHDTDAVYVSVDVAVLRPHAAHEAVGLDGGELIVWAAAFDAAFGRPQGATRASAHPPPRAAPPCPLYVRHLALLI